MKIRFTDPELKQWFKQYRAIKNIPSSAPAERLVAELLETCCQLNDVWQTNLGVEQEIKAIHKAYAAQMRPLEEENSRLRLEHHQWEHHND